MWQTIAKIAGAVGALIIAGVSAYIAYQNGDNHGTHVMHNQANNYGYANNAEPYGYGYQQPMYNNNFNAGYDMNRIVAELNRTTEMINELARRMGYYPIPQPSNNPQVNAWEASGDIALSKLACGIDPNAPVYPQSPYPQFTNPIRLPVSDIGIGALNCSYDFNINNGFNQYPTTDMYRTIADYRMNSLPAYTQYPTFCDMGDPFGGIPSYITGMNNNNVYYGVTPNVPVPNLCPTAPIIDVDPSQLTQLSDGAIDAQATMENIFNESHYGHVGDPLSQPGTIFHYGNI